MKCSKCGTETATESLFCPKCGNRLGPATTAEGPTADDRFKATVRQKQNQADDVEAELWSGGYSPKAMLLQWITAGVVTVAGLIGGAIFMSGSVMGWSILVGVLGAMWLSLAIRLVYRKYSIKYRLTNLRFFFERGLLSRTTDRVEVINIDDVTVRQNFIDRMLGLGNILITSSDKTSPEILMTGIANVRHVADVIDKQRRDLRNRRGLRVEQI